MSSYEVKEDPRLPEDTIFRATLIEAKELTVPYTDKKTGEDKTFEKVEWKWRIETPLDYEGKHAYGDTSAEVTANPNNRFRQIAEALLQREFGVGMSFDLEDLVGLKADITVVHQQARNSDKTFVKVDEVLKVDAQFADEPPF